MGARPWWDEAWRRMRRTRSVDPALENKMGSTLGTRLRADRWVRAAKGRIVQGGPSLERGSLGARLELGVTSTRRSSGRAPQHSRRWLDVGGRADRGAGCGTTCRVVWPVSKPYRCQAAPSFMRYGDIYLYALRVCQARSLRAPGSTRASSPRRSENAGPPNPPKWTSQGSPMNSTLRQSLNFSGVDSVRTSHSLSLPSSALTRLRTQTNEGSLFDFGLTIWK